MLRITNKHCKNRDSEKMSEPTKEYQTTVFEESQTTVTEESRIIPILNIIL